LTGRCKIGIGLLAPTGPVSIAGREFISSPVDPGLARNKTYLYRNAAHPGGSDRQIERGDVAVVEAVHKSVAEIEQRQILLVDAIQERAQGAKARAASDSRRGSRRNAACPKSISREGQPAPDTTRRARI
jgi:hypothetical protein